jgi:small-conductance mechanosensitive channel
MFTRQDTLVESQIRSNLSHWRGFLFIAAGWVSVAPVLIWYLAHHVRQELSWETTVAAWALIAVIGVVCTWTFIRSTYFAVTPSLLQIGRSPRETIVEFSEIESIVVGLPPQQSRLTPLIRLSHYHEAYRRTDEARRQAILLRLRGGRYLA